MKILLKILSDTYKLKDLIFQTNFVTSLNKSFGTGFRPWCRQTHCRPLDMQYILLLSEQWCEAHFLRTSFVKQSPLVVKWFTTSVNRSTFTIHLVKLYTVHYEIQKWYMLTYYAPPHIHYESDLYSVQSSSCSNPHESTYLTLCLSHQGSVEAELN